MSENVNIIAKTHKGLNKLRFSTSVAPTHYCENCKCKRYSPCGCIVSEKNKKGTK